MSGESRQTTTHTANGQKKKPKLDNARRQEFTSSIQMTKNTKKISKNEEKTAWDIFFIYRFLVWCDGSVVLFAQLCAFVSVVSTCWGSGRGVTT